MQTCLHTLKTKYKCTKFASSRHLLKNPSSLEEALNQVNAGNIFNFFKLIDPKSYNQKMIQSYYVHLFKSWKKKF